MMAWARNESQSSSLTTPLSKCTRFRSRKWSLSRGTLGLLTPLWGTRSMRKTSAKLPSMCTNKPGPRRTMTPSSTCSCCSWCFWGLALMSSGASKINPMRLSSSTWGFWFKSLLSRPVRKIRPRSTGRKLLLILGSVSLTKMSRRTMTSMSQESSLRPLLWLWKSSSSTYLAQSQRCKDKKYSRISLETSTMTLSTFSLWAPTWQASRSLSPRKTPVKLPWNSSLTGKRTLFQES